jgi:hypothetical protein
MGGSGSGGGGGSGRVEYPAYMEAAHEDWLSQGGTDTIEASVTEVMNSAIGASPFTGAAAYDPATPLADAWTAVCAFNTLADGLDHEADWLSAISAARSEYDNNVVDTTQIDDDVNAFAQVLQDQLDYVELPKLKAGYRDANAVVSSAYPIAESVITGMMMRDVAKYATELRLKNHLLRSQWILQSAEIMLKNLMQRVQFEQAVAQVSVEAKRIHIVASKEQTDQDYAFDEADGRWDLETFQYGANLLAAIGGGTSNGARERPSKAQSALGGAMSGASAGLALSGGNPIGAAIGGLIGLGASFL